MTRNKHGRKIKVTYQWADGRQGHLFVEFALLGEIYKGIRDHCGTFNILCNGLSYQEHVRQFGGRVIPE